MEPTDFGLPQGTTRNFTNPELRDYITKQIDRGSGNVVQYQVEYHKRIASSFASFILDDWIITIISKEERRYGIISRIGMALSFGYIMLQTRIIYICDKCHLPPMLCGMDTKYNIRISSILLLSQRTKLINK